MSSAASLLAALSVLGCASLSTNAAILSDQSHLGTPYSGARLDLHVLYCFGREIPRDPSVFVLSPLILFNLVDLPPSIALDTLLLPVDIPMQPEAHPRVPGRGGCNLIGM